MGVRRGRHRSSSRSGSPRRPSRPDPPRFRSRRGGTPRSLTGPTSPVAVDRSWFRHSLPRRPRLSDVCRPPLKPDLPWDPGPTSGSVAGRWTRSGRQTPVLHPFPAPPTEPGCLTGRSPERLYTQRHTCRASTTHHTPLLSWFARGTGGAGPSSRVRPSVWSWTWGTTSRPSSPTTRYVSGCTYAVYAGVQPRVHPPSGNNPDPWDDPGSSYGNPSTVSRQPSPGGYTCSQGVPVTLPRSSRSFPRYSSTLQM